MDIRDVLRVMKFALAFICILSVLLCVAESSHAKKLYYRIKEDGTLCITDIPNSSNYKPYKFKKSKNYIRNALAAFKREKKSIKEVQSIVSRLCEKYGVEKSLVMAVIDVESGFNAATVSSAGAQGYRYRRWL